MSGCRRMFGRPLQRSGSNPIYRLEPGTYFPFSPDPCQAPRSPRVVQDQGKARRITGRPKFLREDAFREGIGLLEIGSGWGWGLWPPVRQRGMDYLRARLVTR